MHEIFGNTKHEESPEEGPQEDIQPSGNMNAEYRRTVLMKAIIITLGIFFIGVVLFILIVTIIAKLATRSGS